MGTDHPIESMISILKHLGGFIAVMSPAALAAWWWKGRSHLIPAVVACIGYSAGGGIYRKSGIFFETACILPFVIIVLTVVLWRARRTADVQNRRRHSLAITLATFAFVLTGKMILNCRLYQYGFVLAMPASILMIVVLIYWLPNRLTTIGRAGGLFRGAALGLLMAVSIACLVRTNYYISQKHTTVGTGPDAFLADNRGSPANFVLGEMSALVGPDQTFGVLPEGVMLNYLARRPSGWRHANFMPTEVALFGEEAMLADLRSHPPDYLVLVHKETGEFGFRFFGKDYAAGIMAWIDRNYFELGLAGDRPFVDPLRFGMLLMKRKPPATGGQPPSADRSIGGRPPSADGGPSAGDQPPSADEVGKSPAEP
jgi:hypothetical protein